MGICPAFPADSTITEMLVSDNIHTAGDAILARWPDGWIDNKKDVSWDTSFRLSRNHGFADKQERTVGRSKVVRKFLYRNFLPLRV